MKLNKETEHIILTDSFLIYGFHLLAGRVDQETMEMQWEADRCAIDLAGVLKTALETSRIEEALKALIPMFQVVSQAGCMMLSGHNHI